MTVAVNRRDGRAELTSGPRRSQIRLASEVEPRLLDDPLERVELALRREAAVRVDTAGVSPGQRTRIRSARTMTFGRHPVIHERSHAMNITPVHPDDLNDQVISDTVQGWHSRSVRPDKSHAGGLSSLVASDSGVDVSPAMKPRRRRRPLAVFVAALVGICVAGLVSSAQPASAAVAVGSVTGCFRTNSGLTVTNVDVLLEYYNSNTGWTVPVFRTQPNAATGCVKVSWDSSLTGRWVRLRMNGYNSWVQNTYSGESPWVLAGTGPWNYGTITVRCSGMCHGA